MASALTRRGLFRAFGRADTVTAGGDAMLAHVSDACVEPRGVACRRCGEVCDTDAIAFRPLVGGRYETLIDAERCNGCGACVAVCPVSAIGLVARERAALISGLIALQSGEQ